MDLFSNSISIALFSWSLITHLKISIEKTSIRL